MITAIQLEKLKKMYANNDISLLNYMPQVFAALHVLEDIKHRVSMWHYADYTAASALSDIEEFYEWLELGPEKDTP